jgi:cytochrome c
MKMRRLYAVWATLASLAIASDAYSNEKLAQASGCMTCHGIDNKIIGPSYKEVAAKYRNDNTAPATLFKKVKAGGKGVWGDTPMPPNPHVKDEDIKTMVQWILSLK